MPKIITYIKSINHRVKWAVLTSVILWFIFILLPIPRFNTPYSTLIVDEHDNLLAAHIAQDEQWRFPPRDSVPYKFEKSLLLFEDEYFKYHPGINPISIVRAAYKNIKHKKITSGGSTITMQTVRLANPARRNIKNKLKEMILALRMEVTLSKDSILSIYASQAPFGGNTVGLEAAAWRYFNHPPKELTWAESALLAVLPNSPAMIHPGKNRDALLNKRNRLLEKLYAKDVIDSLTLLLSMKEDLPLEPNALPQITPHLLENAIINNPGTRSKVTIDARLQQLATNAINRHSKYLKQNEIHNAAAIIAKVESGEVVAYVGNISTNNDRSQHVDIIQSARSSGSILKPLLYAAALQEGTILPKSLLPDIPTFYRSFSPRNFQRKYDGAVPAGQALSRSLNIPFVRLLHLYGGEKFLRDLQKAGLSTVNMHYDHYGLSLILGGAEVTLWDLASAYASMARTLNNYTENNGMYLANDIHKLTLTNSTRNINNEKPVSHPPCFSASAIYETFKALAELQRPAEETGWEHFSSARSICWKTGTSYGYRDAWSVGVTPEYVIAVWVGNATGEGRPGIIGGTTAGPIMFELFNLLPRTSKFETPYDELVVIEVCQHSGFRASASCEIKDSIFIPNTIIKSPPCPYHRIVHLTHDGKYQTKIDCEDNGIVKTESFFVLPPVMEYYFKPFNPQYRTLPPVKAGCNIDDSSQLMDFVYPPINTTVFIPIGLDGEHTRVVLNAVHRNKNTAIHWHLNGTFLGTTKGLHDMEIFPTEGRHVITLIDDDGNRITRTFDCKGK